MAPIKKKPNRKAPGRMRLSKLVINKNVSESNGMPMPLQKLKLKRQDGIILNNKVDFSDNLKNHGGGAN